MFPADKVVEEAIGCAEKIAGHSKLIVAMAKEAVNGGKGKIHYCMLQVCIVLAVLTKR